MLFVETLTGSGRTPVKVHGLNNSNCSVIKVVLNIVWN